MIPPLPATTAGVCVRLHLPAPLTCALLMLGLVATAAPAASAAPPTHAAAACQTAQRVEGAFRTVDKPTDLLPGPLTAHAVEPADPRTVYLADTTRVVVSTDAGCTWEPVLQVPAAPATAIRSLVVPETAAPSGRLLVGVTTLGLADGAFASSTTVWSRRGVGQDFRRSAPLPGRVTPVVAPGDSEVVYAATNDLSTSNGTPPFRSDDGGATFLPVPGGRIHQAPNGPSIEGPPRTVAVDPTSRDTLLTAAFTLQRSTDGGRSWQVQLPVADVRHAHALAVHPAGDAAGRAVLAATEQSNSGLQTDGARLWSVPVDGAAEPLPLGPPLIGVPQSLAVGRGADEVVLTTASLPPTISDGYDGPGTLFALDAPRSTWVDVHDGRDHPLLDAKVDRTADPAVHLRTSSLSEPPGVDAYVVWSPPARGRVVPPTVDDGSGQGGQERLPPQFPPAPRACPGAAVFDPPARRASASRLTPPDARLDGPRADHEVVLDLVGDASALDLQILLDISDSMGPAAAGILCGLEELVVGLAEDGVDVRAGLSTFHDQGPGERYVREVDLAPPGLDLQRALRSVRTRGGEETHRTALLQTVTGRGLVADGVELVAPGQAATFRPDALKVVLHVTDEPWSVDTEHEPSPFEVTSALRGAGVRHVGLQVVQRDPAVSAGGDRAAGLADGALLRTQLDQFSSGSGAVAPAGGVDCDSDGTPDLREGDPLVCVGVSDGGVVPLGAAVRALVDALTVRGPVTLRAEATGGATAEVQAAYDDADLRAPARYAFPLALACGPETGEVPVMLVATAGGLDVASARASLACPAPPAASAATGPAKALPAPAAAPAAPQPGQAGLAAAPPPPPPPVVQVPAPAPAAAAAAAGAGAAATSAAAGSAAAGGSSAAGSTAAAGSPAIGTSTGTAPGLAGAPAGPARRAQEAFVSTSSEVPLAAVPLGGGALASAALTAHLLATRRRRPASATLRLETRR